MVGATDAQIGLIMGAFTFSAVCIRLLIGRLGNLFNKKILLIVGVTICMAATGLYYVSASPVNTLMVRLLHGIGFGVATTLYATLSADFIPVKRLGEGIGYFGVGETVGISVGPLLGIWIMNQQSVDSVFIIGTLVLLFATFITSGISYPKSIHIKSKKQIQKKFFSFDSFIEKRVLLQACLAFLMGMSFAGVISFLVLYARAVDIPNVAYFFFVNALVGILVRVPAGRIFDKQGPGVIISASAISCSIGLFILGIAATTTSLIIAAAFYRMGMGAGFPALQA